MSASTTRALLVVLADRREQRKPPLPNGCIYEEATLTEGDYTTRALRNIGVIERKNPEDYGSSLTWGRVRPDREIKRLRPYRFKAIVVESDLGDYVRGAIRTGVHGNAIVGSMASMYARHEVPTFFLHTPGLAGRFIAGTLRRWEQRIAEEGVSAE